MSLDLGGLSNPVTSIGDLIAYVKGAERPPDRWLIGVEHEKIGVRGPCYEPVPYYGPDGIRMTAAVQANLDWSDEADLASKVRAATAVSPVVSAMFANSPLIDGRDCGYLDFRYQVWRETDPARCGLLAQMLQPGWDYRRYVEWAIDVPMLFVRNGTAYSDARGQTFRGWLTSGRLASGEKSQPTLSHWIDHLTTLFPEVRVKRVLELRGADMVPLPLMIALPALWVGILYDRSAREDAAELTRDWTFSELLQFQADVARVALRAKGPAGATALELGRDLLDR